MFMRTIYDEKLAQAAYLIGCQQTGESIVIDPERDVDRYLGLARDNGLRITAIAETHIHADFLSGARELAEKTGARLYLSGEGGRDWQYEWLNQKPGGGIYAHQLLRDGDIFAVGHIELKALHTPGHTPEHMAFLITDRGAGASAPLGLASGDFLFVGDLGRPDLLETAAGQRGAMEPSARRLFQSVSRLGELPEFTQVWPGHGAGSACGKALGAVPMSTIGYERRFNSAIVAAAESEQNFVGFILSGQPEPPLYFARMKRLNKSGPPLLVNLPAPREISAAELLALDAQQAAIIDTRPWDKFRAGHVPGALFFPLNRSFPTDVGSMVGENEDIYLIVERQRVDEAVRDLVRIGLDRVAGWFPAGEIAEVGAAGKLQKIAEISAEEARKLLAGGARVLDVRKATEFADGHLPDAINFSHTRLAAHLEEIPRGQPWIVNCLGGGRSARACALLKRRGFDVMNLKGGYSAWQQAQG